MAVMQAVGGNILLAANLIQNAGVEQFRADNATVGTSFETISNNDADVVQIGEGAGDTIDVVSSSGDDVMTTGTGGWSVVVEGLDVNFLPQSETIELNGATAVPGLLTYVFVNRVYLSAAGTGLALAGQLTIADVTGSTVIGKIDIGKVEMANLIYMVPANSTGYCYGFTADVDAVAAGAGMVEAALQTVRTGLQGAIASETWDTIGKLSQSEGDGDVVQATGGNANGSGGFEFPGQVPWVLPPKTIVRVAGKAGTGTAAITGTLQIVVHGVNAGTTITAN